MGTSFILSLRRSLVFLVLITFSQLATAAPLCRDIFLLNEDAYLKQMALLEEGYRFTHLKDTRPASDKAFGSDSPILHAFEKEGLYYKEIQPWFSELKDSGKKKLAQRMSQELKAGKAGTLTHFLRKLTLDSTFVPEAPLLWGWMKPEKKLDFLLSLENPFAALSINDKQFLIEKNIINFDDVGANNKAPKLVTVGDDLGSYEVRSTTGVADRKEYAAVRAETEKFLEGKIGHQHFFHAWPKDPAVREKMAPYYVELLDSTAWYLFWRQMKRNPKHVSSILTHKYLGVYTRNSLIDRHENVVTNDTKRFNDKFRMIGARSFPAQIGLDPKNATEFVTDWELRSGNKGAQRDLIESMLESRLVSGDYTGIRDFRSYNFDPSAPIQDIVGPFVRNGKDIQTLEQFELLHPMMEYSTRRNAKNHMRNRILAPLLPWENRLDLAYKLPLLQKAQTDYARGLVKVAEKYLRAVKQPHISNERRYELRDEVVEKLEVLVYKFTTATRLHMDFENYLRPKPKTFPSIRVNATGPINPNTIPLGIEYSFRFPLELRPTSQKMARDQILSLAEDFAVGRPVQEISKTTPHAHGHGVSVKFTVQDSQNRTWRFEWDGIQREYNKQGLVENAWGGHTEVVTPKFSPEEITKEVNPLYITAAKHSMYANRSYGGAHVNFDISFLQKLPAKQGTRAVLNLISFYESHQDMIRFMWQSPRRTHAAYPVKLTPDFAQKIATFKGDWKDLGKMLYESRYFNTFIGRKPKYVPLNLTALMTDIVPTSYIEKTLDIRNEKQAWFPNFNKVHGRGEARLFDAPTNAENAALQIKYWRALMDKAFNSTQPIPLVRKYSADIMNQWKAQPEKWLQDAEAHLKDLGLNPEEFRFLLWESYLQRMKLKERQKDYEEFKDFLPPQAILKFYNPTQLAS